MLHLDFLTQEEKELFKTAFEIDQRWLIEHAGDRTPFVCQAQSLNVFLPANVHKSICTAFTGKHGRKALLYYCRSKSIQRAESDASWKRSIADNIVKENQQMELGEEKKYEECLACQ